MPPNNSPLGPSDRLKVMPKPEDMAKIPSPTPTPLPTQAQSPVTPVRPPSGPSAYAPQPKKRGKLGLVIFIVIILLLGGFGAYAYFTDMFPSLSSFSVFSKPPYDNEKLASSIFNGIGKIKSASYSLNISVVSEPRESDAEPFSVAVPTDANKVQAYKRDQDKVRDIQSIIRNLNDYYYKKKSYPNSLLDLPQVTSSDIESDPTNLPYKYYRSEDGSDFSLIVQFETSDATDAIKSTQRYSQNAASSTTISGKTVTLTKKSYSYFYLPAEPKQPAFVDILKMQDSLSFLPTDFKLNSTISAATKKIDDKTVDFFIHTAGALDLGDLNFAMDVEFRKIADNVYVLISKFPTLFFDISKLKGKWIKITPQDAATFGGGFFGSTPDDAQEEIAKKKEQTAESIKLFLDVADKNRALVNKKSPASEKVGDVDAYRYELQMNKDTLAQFYTDLTTEHDKKITDKSALSFDQGTADYLKSPEFEKAFDYLRKNTTLIVWADQDGIPIKAEYSIRVVPDSKQKVDRQIRMIFTLTLNDVNESIDIDIPSGSMSVEDATIALTGQSKEQYQFQKQVSTVQAIQYALTSYKQIVGSYPKSLDDLKKTREELKKISTTKSTDDEYDIYYPGTNYEKKPIMQTIPEDFFAKKPFVYTNKGSDYTLTYTMVLPKYEKGSSVSGIYRMDYSTLSSNNQYKIVMTAVSGTNTADSKVLSKEAVSQSALDSDRDLLPDVLENYIGTNKSKKDTDGDGYSDYEEITRSTDPLGPGNLKRAGYGVY